MADSALTSTCKDQQQYAIRNENVFEHVGKWCWGISASDGPGSETREVAGVERTFCDYVARSAPYGPDDGTLAPWAMAASLPFAPEVVEATIAHLATLEVGALRDGLAAANFRPA